MKKVITILSVFILIIMLIFTTACGSQKFAGSEENSEASISEEMQSVTEVGEESEQQHNSSEDELNTDYVINE